MLGGLNLTKLIRSLLIISLLYLVIGRWAKMWAKIVDIWNFNGELLKDLFLKVWLRYAIGMSIYWGIRNLILYTTDLVERLGPEHQRLYFLRKRGKFWGIFLLGGYEFIFNFVGSFAGWCCLYIFIKHASFTDLRLTHLVLLILAIMGLGGRLPRFILGIIKLPTAVANYISKKLGLEIE